MTIDPTTTERRAELREKWERETENGQSILRFDTDVRALHVHHADGNADGLTPPIASWGDGWGELIVAAVNALPSLLNALDRTQSGGRTLGRIVDRLHREMLDATGAHDLIGEDGDGDWQLVSELLQELRPARDAALARAAKAESTLTRVRDLLDRHKSQDIDINDVYAALDGTS